MPRFRSGDGGTPARSLASPLGAGVSAPFCPRHFRRWHLGVLAGWVVSAALVAFALAVYFLAVEPAIGADDPSLDRWVSLLFVALMLGSFSIVPLTLPFHRVPEAVSASGTGLTMTHVRLGGRADTVTAWENVLDVEFVRIRRPPSTSFFLVRYRPGGARWGTNTLPVEPDLLAAWRAYLPLGIQEKLRASLGSDPNGVA